MKKLALLLGIVFCSNLFAAAAADDVQAARPTPHPIIWNMGALNEEALIGLDVPLIQRKNHLAAPLYVMKDVSALRIMEIRPPLLLEALTYLNSSGFRLLNLTDLDLSQNRNLSSPLLERILREISHLAPNLVTLKIQCCGFEDEQAKIISQTMPKLTTLDIGWNRLEPVAAESISQMRQLITLNIQSNYLGANGAEFISKMGNLRTLYIRENDIRDRGASYISQMPHLTTLDIHENDIGYVGVKRIAKMTWLKTLDVGGYNEIYDRGDGHALLIQSLPNTAITF